MSSVVLFGLGLVVLVFFVASLWYLFQTIRIMWRFSFFIAIAAIFFSPLIHIIFYFFPKSGFDSYERGVFKKYFFSLGAIFILGLTASVLIPAMDAQKLLDAMDERYEGEPWEWDIRVERLD